MILGILRTLIEKRLFYDIDNAEYNSKTDEIEIIGRDHSGEDFIVTVQVKRYNAPDRFGFPGGVYKGTRKRRVKRNKEWVTIEEPVDRYRFSDGDKKFIYDAYVNMHLSARQISKISKVPQPYVYQFIKRNKLKPKYSRNIPKTGLRGSDYHIGHNYSRYNMTDHIINNLLNRVNLESKNKKDTSKVNKLPDDYLNIIPNNLDGDINPFLTRGEVKVQREEGL